MKRGHGSDLPVVPALLHPLEGLRLPGVVLGGPVRGPQRGVLRGHLDQLLHIGLLRLLYLQLLGLKKKNIILWVLREMK